LLPTVTDITAVLTLLPTFSGTRICTSTAAEQPTWVLAFYGGGCWLTAGALHVRCCRRVPNLCDSSTMMQPSAKAGRRRKHRVIC
jgi:hypothetical protein